MKQQLRIMLLILAMIAGGASSELHAMDDVSYVDSDGTVKTRNGVTELNDVTQFGNLAPGWYIVTYNIVCYDIRIEVSAPTGDENGDVHIIIQNGVTMDITDNGITIINEHGTVYFHAESNEDTPGMIIAINSIGDKTIYANCDITFNGLNVEAKSPPGVEAILSDGNITVNSGSITVTGGDFGIFCNGFFTMNGGTVDASSNYYGITADKGIVFNGGNLTANGTEVAGIDAEVTLMWTSPDDSFTASGISNYTTVTIPVGYAFTDGTVIYQSGGYDDSHFSNDFTLTPVYKISVTSLNSSGDEVTEFYNTLTDAFNAAKTAYVPGNGSDVAEFIPTVTLHDDIDTEGTITLDSPGESVFVTLDLDGHTLSGDDNELIYVTGLYRLIIDDSAGDGRIVNTGTRAIYNNAYVLVKGGTFAGSTYCIDNIGQLDVSGGTFVMGEYANGIMNQGSLTFTGLPRFVHSSDMCFSDIRLYQNTYITFGEGTYVVPERPITVLIYNNEPYTFTSNYGTYVKSGENVIDPADIFIPFNVHEGLRVCMDGDGAEARIVEASAAAVTLYDDADNSSSIVRNQFANVTLSGRTLAMDGTWNTLCLPFDVYDFEAMDYNDNYLFFPLVNATVKELDIDGTYDENGYPAVDGPYRTGLDTQTGELRLYFREVRRIEAGKPYIVKWDAGEGAYLTNPVFRNVILKDDIKPMTFPGGTFVEQFSPFEIVNDAVDFSTTLGNINEILFLSTAPNSTTTVLGYSANPRTLRSCRAHFYVPAGQGVSAVRSINLNFGDDGEATGIVAQPTLNSQFSVLNSGAWYSLDGRKLSGEPKAKGVYIHNSKKIIIK